MRYEGQGSKKSSRCGDRTVPAAAREEARGGKVRRSPHECDGGNMI
jgi:hypothetical protein